VVSERTEQNPAPGSAHQILVETWLIDGPERARSVESKVLYRILRWITTWYPLGVLWLCIAAMIVAFSLMFVFPPGTLLLLFIGLAGLGAAVIGFRALQALQRGLARRAIAHGVCPSCKTRQPWPTEGETWRCESCGTSLLVTGAEAPAPENNQWDATEHSSTPQP
jgi:ribosomal protein L37AE/L43A